MSSKQQRDLSGVYFRYQNPQNNKWENWCFEDLPEEKQQEIMNGRGEEWLKSLVIILSNTINKISEQFEITAHAQD